MAAKPSKSNKQQVLAARRAKIEDARRKERARDRRNRLIAIVSSAVVVAALVTGIAIAVAGAENDDKESGPKLNAASASDIRGEKTWSGLTQTHVETDVDYPMNPPVGGDHSAIWMNCDADVYTEEIPDENAVHSLEHGAVWVTYNESATEADIETLATRVSATPYSLMSPKNDQKSPITLTAWGHQLTLDSASDERVAEFFDTYVQGAQTPEPGAACSGGRAE
ncbi:DUF3105 domain-containing protein [Streptomyces specialis]|uniref:DUF3105 domain-containing protein n=1 Tax=Streptomyces specialis TaxID=498367 RepID=UPI00073F5850|nr:DUF3105 domain-containing protein [Streptomyces specialis]